MRNVDWKHEQWLYRPKGLDWHECIQNGELIDDIIVDFNFIYAKMTD